MTSKNFFFKVMREDLRHKTWMLALSILTSVLMVLVVWLVWWSNHSGYGAAYGAALREADRISGIQEVILFFREYVSVMGGVQTIIGALVTGLFGFRYVFHKNMADTYYSLPVKRNTLFAAGYLNGVLIWMLPFGMCLVPTAAMAGSFLRQIGGSPEDIGGLFREAGISFLNLTVIYLLVYGMVLTAVMLSGNILNTLVSMAVLGFGGISAFGICYGFFVFYMDHFYATMVWDMVSYLSPLFAAPVLIYWRVSRFGGGKIAIAFLLAAALSLCAWRLYSRRRSELAEQGIRNKAAAAVIRLLAGIVAGMGGWILFIMLADRWTIVWGIFGMALALTLVFGVLNIMFAMDFKAFFSQKRQLAALLAVTLLICFAFHWDWFGYDEYLPEQEDIAEMAFYDSNFANRYIPWSSEGVSLENMRFQDAEAIHACLERLTDADRKGVGSAQMTVRVTLESGRSYYRRYPRCDDDRDVIWPLLTSEEYLQQAFCVSDEMVKRCRTFYIRSGDEREEFKTSLQADELAAIVKAYNQDVLENPEGAFLSQGRLLAQVELDVDNEGGGIRRITLSVYETMERTLEAMRAGGFGEWLEMPGISDVQAIVLRLYGHYELRTEEDVLKLARQTYGVNQPEQDGKQGAADSMESDEWQTDGSGLGESIEERAEVAVQTVETWPDTEAGWISMEVEITDAVELEELLPWISFTEPAQSDSVFRSGYMSIFYVDTEGEVRNCHIPKGVLPEKYILRFGDCS